MAQSPIDDNDLVTDLTCAICQEIYYQPVTLLNCLHVFCASCYSQHLSSQRDCPICREQVIGIRRNHTMTKIINIYLKLNPALERSQAEKDASDLVNVINSNVDFTQDGSSRNMVVRDSRYLMYPIPCRSCAPDNNTGYTCSSPIPASAHPEITPNLPTSWDIPTPHGHLRCYDCEKFMPARYRDEQPNLLQACSFCRRTYCHLYWGCEQPDRSHLGKLADIPIAQIFELSASESNFNASDCLNNVDRQFLRQYLEFANITLNQAWQKCMSMLDNDSYVCSAAQDMTAAAQDHCSAYRQPLEITSNDSMVTSARPSSILLACASCKVDVFWGQMFGYCKSIQPNSMPERMRNRENCWYGKECRTQWHNTGHALRRNHACERTGPPPS